MEPGHEFVFVFFRVSVNNESPTLRTVSGTKSLLFSSLGAAGWKT